MFVDRVRIAPDGTRTHDLSITDRLLSGFGNYPVTAMLPIRGSKAPLSYGRDPHTELKQTPT